MESPSNKHEGSAGSLGAELEQFLPSFEETYRTAVKEFLARLPEPEWEKSLKSGLGEYLLRRGKRIRPLLFFAAYRIFSGRAPAAALARPAVGLELFHNFVLIHDDVIDQASTRRGRPSLQAVVAEALQCSLPHAEDIVVVLGDILFSFSAEQFISEFGDPVESIRLLPHFLKLAQWTGNGEALELMNTSRAIETVTEDSIRKTYDLKTTRYTFEGPLYLGALLAGSDTGLESAIREIARPLGLAFQLENDLHELRDPETHCAGFAADFTSGIKTLALKRFIEQAPSAEKSRWTALLEMGTPALNDLESLHRAMRDSSVVHELEELTSACFQGALDAVNAGPYSRLQKEQLTFLVRFAQSRSYHSEATPPANLTESV